MCQAVAGSSLRSDSRVRSSDGGERIPSIHIQIFQADLYTFP